MILQTNINIDISENLVLTLTSNISNDDFMN
jgi:hypothetical protein